MKIASERISYLKVDIAAVIERLVLPLVKAPKRKPVAMIEDILWELGWIDIGRGSRIASLWFARRLHDNVEWKKVERIIRDRPAPDLRIVLTTTSGYRIPDAFFRNHLIVPVSTVLRHGGGLTIDGSILASRVKSPYGVNNGPIQHSADYAYVSIGGKNYNFSGSKQRSIVRSLLQALEAGNPQCSTAEVLAEAESGGSVNTLAKAFSGRDDWKDFIAEANGMCWAFL